MSKGRCGVSSIRSNLRQAKVKYMRWTRIHMLRSDEWKAEIVWGPCRQSSAAMHRIRINVQIASNEHHHWYRITYLLYKQHGPVWPANVSSPGVCSTATPLEACPKKCSHEPSFKRPKIRNMPKSKSKINLKVHACIRNRSTCRCACR